MRVITAMFAVLLLVAPGATQATAPKPGPQAPARVTDKLPAIESLARSIRDKRAELRVATTKQPSDPAEVEELTAQVRRLEADLDSIASGIDRTQVDNEARTTSLNDDLEELLRPLLRELKDATEEPRALERLRTQAASQERRAAIAAKAIQNVEAVQRAAPDDPVVRDALQATLEQWRALRQEAINGQTVALAQLEQRERDRTSLFESASALIGSGFRSKGLHLLLAALAFLAVFVGCRFGVSRGLRLIGPRRKADERPFYYRLLHVLSQVVITMAATFAALLVLYTTGDWVLLGVGLLFLLGVVWAAKNTLPRLLEETRLLLNLGPVREHERVVFEGLPWRVERLSFYTKLSNPALSGGTIRLPVRQLASLHSRPCLDKEVWFPCAEEDWVALSDGTRGKVLRQTPETVQLVKLGGSRVTYRTTDFLDLTPENLSANFRLAITFGVDYQHQAICTDRIPQLMHQRLQREIEAKIGADNLVNLTVEFQEAASSSLDYAVLVDLSGEVAARIEPVRRFVQRTLVDLCNEHGWVIPFTQITVHRADG
ncbi:MAG: hypothetical protein KDE27_25390 [Planctomycetes bacterium]|nr:hypothetical protein [Planctomycetota bacterium]